MQICKTKYQWKIYYKLLWLCSNLQKTWKIWACVFDKNNNYTSIIDSLNNLIMAPQNELMADYRITKIIHLRIKLTANLQNFRLNSKIKYLKIMKLKILLIIISKKQQLSRRFLVLKIKIHHMLRNHCWNVHGSWKCKNAWCTK